MTFRKNRQRLQSVTVRKDAEPAFLLLLNGLFAAFASLQNLTVNDM